MTADASSPDSQRSRAEELALDVLRTLAERHLDGDRMRHADESFRVRELDSLTRTALLVEIEDRFEVILPDDALAEVDTLADMARLVVRAMSQPPPIDSDGETPCP